MIVISGAGIRMDLDFRPYVTPKLGRSIKASQRRNPCL